MQSKCVVKMVTVFLGLTMTILSISQLTGAQQSPPPAPSRKNDTRAMNLTTREYEGFRKVNWAITGFDEPMLHKWPFSQFVPILRQNRYYPKRNPKYRYRLEFNEIYSRVPGVGRTTVNCYEFVDSPWCRAAGNATTNASTSAPAGSGPNPTATPEPYTCDPLRENCQRPVKQFDILRVHSKLYKTVHIALYAEEKRNASQGLAETWIPAKLEGVLLQGNHNPLGVGLPTGEFYLDEEYRCVDCPMNRFGVIIPARKRPIVEVVHPTLLGFHHRMKWVNLEQKWEVAGVRPTVHANYRWYSAPCSETKRLQFTLMAVHSFQNNTFDILNLGPYEVRFVAQANHSDIIPSPVFHPLFYHNHLAGTWCHAASAPDVQTVRQSAVQLKEFEFSHSYDECVREEPIPKRKQIGEVKTTVETFFCDDPEQPKCDFWEKAGRRLESTFGPWSETPCPKPCPNVNMDANQAQKQVDDDSLFKRGIHGAFLIMTNFCIMPISTFMARFFKETYNIKTIKGAKSWFWFHLVGSMFSCILIYIGTFHPGEDQNTLWHVYLGKVYIIVLALCYFTAWGRHRNHWFNITLEFMHGCLGYTTIILAHATMHTAPGVGRIPKLLCDLQICLHVLFMFVITYDICKQDKKFGMRPKRRHFPTVEARFDDIELPKHHFRIVLLQFLAVVTFFCSLAACFFQ